MFTNKQWPWLIQPRAGKKYIQVVLLAHVDFVSNHVELAWIISYPLPNKVIVNRRKILIQVQRNNNVWLRCEGNTNYI